MGASGRDVWRLSLHTFVESREHGGDFHTSGSALGVQGVAALAGEDALANGPGHGLSGPVGDGSAVGKGGF